MPKISISLPAETISDLDHISKSLGYSRSALISVLLVPSVDGMMSVVGSLPLDSPSDSELKRFRGDSKKNLSSLVDDISLQINDLNRDIGGL